MVNIRINPIPDEVMTAALKPAAEAFGKATGTILTAAYNKILMPLVKFNIRTQQEADDYTNRIKNHIDPIPVENRDASKIDLVLKAIDDSKYRIGDTVMREAFARLIAKGLDNRSNGNFYPAYSDILANMSSIEAKLLTDIHANFGSQVVTELIISSGIQKPGEQPLMSKAYIFDHVQITDGSLDIAVELLRRSNLIEIHDDRSLAHEHYHAQYEAFEKEWDAVKNDIPGFDPETQNLKFEKGFIRFTEFGKSFMNLISDEE